MRALRTRLLSPPRILLSANFQGSFWWAPLALGDLTPSGEGLNRWLGQSTPGSLEEKLAVLPLLREFPQAAPARWPGSPLTALEIPPYDALHIAYRRALGLRRVTTFRRFGAWCVLSSCFLRSSVAVPVLDM